MMLEFIQGGEMFTHLRGVGRYQNKQSMLYAAQITSIFEHLQTKDII